MATALFVCLHNAGRSQMSAALFEREAAGRHTALSAGTTPAARVHPEVIQVMNELGIDLSGLTPRKLTTELARQADVVVTMGCGDSCPYIPGKRYIEWDLADPRGRPLEEVRATRDDIAERVRELVAELDSASPTRQAGQDEANSARQASRGETNSAQRASRGKANSAQQASQGEAKDAGQAAQREAEDAQR